MLTSPASIDVRSNFHLEMAALKLFMDNVVRWVDPSGVVVHHEVMINPLRGQS